MAFNNELIKRLNERAPGRRVMTALEKLITSDAYLLSVDANERSITHRLGIYLQCEFDDYFVDCEYNRDGLDPKRIGEIGTSLDNADTDGRTVFPDIVVHRRGTQDNYPVIEVKKSSSMVSREVDRKKLRAYKSEPTLGYKFALFIELKVGVHPGILNLEWMDA